VDGAGFWKQTLGVAMRSTQARLTSPSPVTQFELTLSRLLFGNRVRLLCKQGTQHFVAKFSTCNRFRENAILLKAVQTSDSTEAVEDKAMKVINLPDYNTAYWIKLAQNRVKGRVLVVTIIWVPK
jgi:hypothetical protein